MVSQPPEPEAVPTIVPSTTIDAVWAGCFASIGLRLPRIWAELFRGRSGDVALSTMADIVKASAFDPLRTFGPSRRMNL
jgi:hypothetical protein